MSALDKKVLAALRIVWRLEPIASEIDRAALLEAAPLAVALRRWADALAEVDELKWLLNAALDELEDEGSEAQIPAQPASAESRP